jgi:hypothetical protein
LDDDDDSSSIVRIESSRLDRSCRSLLTSLMEWRTLTLPSVSRGRYDRGSDDDVSEDCDREAVPEVGVRDASTLPPAVPPHPPPRSSTRASSFMNKKPSREGVKDGVRRTSRELLHDVDGANAGSSEKPAPGPALAAAPSPDDDDEEEEEDESSYLRNSCRELERSSWSGSNGLAARAPWVVVGTSSSRPLSTAVDMDARTSARERFNPESWTSHKASSLAFLVLILA